MSIIFTAETLDRLDEEIQSDQGSIERKQRALESRKQTQKVKRAILDLAKKAHELLLHAQSSVQGTRLVTRDNRRGTTISIEDLRGTTMSHEKENEGQIAFFARQVKQKEEDVHPAVAAAPDTADIQSLAMTIQEWEDREISVTDPEYSSVDFAPVLRTELQEFHMKMRMLTGLLNDLI